VNTGAVCHLDASMVERALAELRPPPGSIVAIENVGNLVCPSLFDLGEARRVAVLSVTEGEDKPVKYPHMFRGCHVVVLNKMDLAHHVDFDLGACLGYVSQVNPASRVIQVSAKTGDGFGDLHAWLAGELDTAGASRSGVEAVS
jgi:hydrogenase nickel incorporation protein HypB